MSPLTTNVCPLELEDDIDGFVSVVNVESSNNDDTYGMEIMSSYYDVEAYEVSESNVSTHIYFNHIEHLIDNHIHMATQIECTFLEYNEVRKEDMWVI